MRLTSRSSLFLILTSGFILSSFLLNPMSAAQDENDQEQKLQQAEKKKNQSNNTLQNIEKKTQSVAKSAIKNVKSKPTKVKNYKLVSAGMQKLNAKIYVSIILDKQKSKTYNENFEKLCKKVKIIGKKPDGKIHRFQTVYTQTFNIKSESYSSRSDKKGFYACKTKSIVFPANQEIHFVASVIDKNYRVTPLTQKAKFKPDTPLDTSTSKGVYVKLIKK